jgi:hypothetical protein
MGGGIASLEISGTGVKRAEPLPHLIWDRERNEISYLRAERGANFQHQGKFAPFIALENVEVMAGDPAIAVLRAMANECERFVSEVESESRNIGLIGSVAGIPTQHGPTSFGWHLHLLICNRGESRGGGQGGRH